MNFLLEENHRMKRGILEVLVVNAKGIIHTNFVGILISFIFTLSSQFQFIQNYFFIRKLFINFSLNQILQEHLLTM